MELHPWKTDFQQSGSLLGVNRLFSASFVTLLTHLKVDELLDCHSMLLSLGPRVFRQFVKISPKTQDQEKILTLFRLVNYCMDSLNCTQICILTADGYHLISQTADAVSYCH